jgi:hypothetical protein
MTDQTLYNNPNKAYQTSWIVYINGLQVPVVSASVSYGVWQIPECELTVIPDPILTRLGAEDRIAVQVFYCDYWQEPGQAKFRLMFDGEIVGWSYVNVQRGRAISFNCVDYIQIWTQLFFFFMSNVDDVAVGVSAEEIGVGINEVTLPGFGPIYPYSLFAQGLTGEGSPAGEDTDSQEGNQTVPLIERPIDFIYNVVRGLIDANLPNRSVPAANFFAPWTQRTKFHRRWVALPYLERASDPGIFPILRAVRADFAVQAVAQMTSRIGSSASIWEMFHEILQVLMMEINMLPTPAAVKSDHQSLEIQGLPPEQTRGMTPIFLTNYFTKPQFLFGVPPVCNVFFPSQLVHYAYNEDYITQPTRMYFSEESWVNYLNTDANVSPGLGALLRDALAVAHPEEVHQAARSAVDNPGENGKNLLVFPEEFFKGPVVDRRPMPTWFAFLGQSQVNNETTPTEGGEDAEELADETTTPSSDIAPGDTDRNVFRLYAKYEYFKERYSRRTGGLQLAFNPYPVPGFPCAIFDHRSTQVDTVGYIMNVRQNLFVGGWQTQVSYSYGRTFQEMFGLMRQQFEFETQVIRERSAETIADVAIASTGAEGERSADFSDRAELIGAIASAPPEPIREIRDIIQNFQRAEQFYRSLFFRTKAPDADAVTSDQVRDETDRRTLGTDPVPLQESNGLQPRPQPAGTDAGVPDLGIRRAAFYYPEIVELVDPESGQAEGIQIEGIDATARDRLLSTIAQMRDGAASQVDMAFLAISLGRSTLPVQQAGQPADPNVVAELNAIEMSVRNLAVTTNVRGDTYIRPKAEAMPLFDTYDAAMQYNARPICTLDEYVNFLGADGIREGRVDPLVSLQDKSEVYHPAHFYVRIRNYRPGPPPVLPSENITNAPVVTGGDGIVSADTEDTTEGTGPTQHPQVRPLPNDFPQNRQDWNRFLTLYRQKALFALAPRN